ncbi:MAG: proline dehydrogenase family protein [Bacteroidetes bacterium]|nr:proline dehydrogenase family protein [Bacteroidota bacterium]MBU1483350.1 proline dehydrogenase family protein [Bacteroidota bacterium]MBU2267030.1 proline dehydrogenase family protein [Bacteroidota bacterium]MBU2376786.1 proline dehydrogenase family protein [Bacteroidota bacterium]
MPDFISKNNLSFDDTKIAFKHQSDKDLKRSFWLFKMISNNLLVKIGPLFTKAALAIRIPISGLIKATIFKQFCGGETINECTSTIEKLADVGVGTILDYSVEGEEDEDAFDQTEKEIIYTIKKAVELPQAIPFCVFKVTGLARFGLLEKINDKVDLKEFEKLEWKKALNRIEEICKTAYEAQKHIMIDAEESWIQDVIDDVAIEMMRKFNKEKAIVFNTYQLYRHDKLSSLIVDEALARTEGFYLGAKLVRGAYMEKERKRAAEMDYTSPIQPDKTSTDKDYNAAVDFCLENISHVSFVAGTHNQHSCQLLADEMELKGIEPKHPHVYFSQLLGMSDNLSFNLSNAGYNVAKYVPYGPLKAVLPYLFRRAEENTAIAGQMGRELKLISKEMKRRKI